MKSSLFVIAFLAAVSIVHCQGVWEEPYFEDPGDDRITFESQTAAYTSISMDEELEPDLIIAYITYEGETEPKITEYPEGDPELLGAQIQKIRGRWAVVVTNKVDYELMTGSKKMFVFSIGISGIRTDINLNINNIDDNAPVVFTLSYPCQIKENFAGITECQYNLTDKDGWLPEMKFQIEGSSNENDFFKFEYKDPPDKNAYHAIVILHTKLELDFEKISLYSFDWIVTDTGDNQVTTKVLIKVIDMPDEPPRWTSIFSYQEFNEKEPKSFVVEAIDGDVEIGAKINYGLNSAYNKLIIMDNETGTITVPNGIDRDTLKVEVFIFEIIAYEVDEPSSFIKQQVTFMVNDINDNPPKINTSEWGDDRTLRFTIPESKVTPLNSKIEIEDRDLGVNAMYEVLLKDYVYIKNFTRHVEPFQIIPTSGYQQSSFTLAIVDSTLLDYESDEWRKFKFQIYVEENENKTHTDTAWVEIELTNWNDELPEFTKDEYIAEVLETIESNEFIIQVEATDKDIDDYVRYSLIGTAVNNILVINNEIGEIKTKTDNAFDYEKQQEVVVQIEASDNLGDIHHKTFAQLTIKVVDVNDETPKIEVPGAISVEENMEHEYLINDEITATDEDTTANLEFSIDWSSSYAMKNLRRLPDGDFAPYKECVKVRTVNISTNPSGYVKAELTINEVVPENTPDFEVFDYLYLKLTVVDLNQQVGLNNTSVMISISITDVNDNAPEFVEGTDEKNYTVIEGSNANTLVTTIIATDKDASPYNNVSYFIKEIGDTPANWLQISEEQGLLTVMRDNIIDADLPLWYLNYTVIASDSQLENSIEISVYIIDTNNKVPQIEEVDKIVYVEEKSNKGTEIPLKIVSTDADRDAPNNVVWYTLRNADDAVKNNFKMDEVTGNIIVENDQIDRDAGMEQFIVNFEAVDCYKGSVANQLSTFGTFTIKVVDINDKTPIIQTKLVETNETLKKGESIPEKIIATDADEPGNDNSKIQFKIEEIRRGEGAQEEPPEDLFTIKTDDAFETGEATLTANYDLRKYYGTYILKIRVTDLGETPNSASYEVSVNVSKYNFEKPSFIEPPEEQNKYILSQKLNSPNKPLVFYNNEPVPDIRATDNQDGKWDITFHIAEDPEFYAHEIFDINNLGQSKGQLYLKSTFDPLAVYKFTIVAEDNGNPPYTASCELEIHFYDLDQQPHFIEEEREKTVMFHENKTGLEESQEIYKASYNNLTDIDVFYHLSLSEDSRYFKVDKKSGDISLGTELDYETKKEHYIEIIAGNGETPPTDADEESILKITVKVIDVNDNEPYFNSSFSSIITTDNQIGDTVLKIEAYDEDENEQFTYNFVEGSLEAHGDGLSISEESFKVLADGTVQLGFKVVQTMDGYFQFTVKVVDRAPENHAAETAVKIFIVSEKQRVEFRFENELQIVLDKQDRISKILSDHFGFTARIEKIHPDSNSEGEPLQNQTLGVVYFIDVEKNEPISRDDIIKQLSDLNEFAKLRTAFLSDSLLLTNFNTDNLTTNLEEILKAWLIGISVVLGCLCIILLIAYIVKTRILQNRLNKLSTIQFGSQASGINRAGIVAPTTNKRMIEGANPVFGELTKTSQMDGISIRSGDSDLIGVEDYPEFDYKPNDKKAMDYNVPPTPTTPTTPSSIGV